MLRLDGDLCCTILKMQSGCNCPANFNLQQEFAISVTNVVAKVFDMLIEENVILTENVKCNETVFNMATYKRFNEILENVVKDEEIIQIDKGTIRLKFKGIIDVGMNESVANYNENQIVVGDGKSIGPIKPYYRIGITHAIPWSYKQTDSDTGVDYWTGYCADFATKLADMMNFDFEFVEPKSGTFGKKRDGVWDGVIGDLATGVCCNEAVFEKNSVKCYF